MRIEKVKLSKLRHNTGQAEGLPKNPRVIKNDKYEKLLKSLKEDPEMLELRELIVYDNNGQYVVIAGNMRLKALRELKETEAPCKILPPETPVDKLKRYTIKDNNSFGSHDMDLLANEWDYDELIDWGTDLPEIDIPDVDFPELAEGDKEPFQQMTFTLADEQAEQIKNAIAEIKKTDDYKYCETFGNENSNGNALYLLVAQR
jgi:hypothetical protein